MFTKQSMILAASIACSLAGAAVAYSGDVLVGVAIIGIGAVISLHLR